MTRCRVCHTFHPESPPCSPDDGPGPSKAAERAMRDHVAREGCGLTACKWDVCATHRPKDARSAA